MSRKILGLSSACRAAIESKTNSNMLISTNLVVEMVQRIRELEIYQQRTIKSMSWMVKDMKWKADQLKGNGDYSPELKKAIEVLRQLKDYANQECGE